HPREVGQVHRAGAQWPQEQRRPRQPRHRQVRPRKGPGPARRRYVARRTRHLEDFTVLTVRGRVGSGLVPDGPPGQGGPRMSTRTTRTTVTFHKPFTLSPVDGPHPAGTYQLEAEEEQVEVVSFGAFRRTTMLLFLPA